MTAPTTFNLHFTLAFDLTVTPIQDARHCQECMRVLLAEVKVTHEDGTSHTEGLCSKHLADNYSPLATDIMLAHAVDYPDYLD